MPGPAEDWDASFPKGGVDRSAAFARQPARPASSGSKQYVKTTRYGQNVRGVAPGVRDRGGRRMGLTRFLDAKVSGSTWVVQELNLLGGEGYDPSID